MITKTWDELIACAKREAAMRRNVYQKRVALGQMRESTAAHELMCADEIVMVLERVKEREKQDKEFHL